MFIIYVWQRSSTDYCQVMFANKVYYNHFSSPGKKATITDIEPLRVTNEVEYIEISKQLKCKDKDTQ